MNDYVELKLTISPASSDASDVMAALLAETGFESFVPNNQGLTAYIRSELYDQQAVETIVNDFPMGNAVITSDVLIPGRDWNKEWEQNFFKPIVVGEQCVIHSSFHSDFPKVPYDIVIDPKMAFGTGHHATTSQVIESI
ncbi:MAG: 50S ribosomal protein L11 methyltransferase, partial [Muribaculaceae bacterium]|nr:50S ribosomal protein L11 methyltransferase [Muribaculaceae bacterium]